VQDLGNFEATSKGQGLAQKSVEYFYQIVQEAIKWQPTNTTHQLEEN
jgi:hypothetical protein